MMWCCSFRSLFSTDHDEYADDRAGSLPSSNGCVCVPVLRDDDDGPIIPNARKGKFVAQPDRAALPKGVRSKTLEEYRRMPRSPDDRQKAIPDVIYGNDGEGVRGTGSVNVKRKWTSVRSRSSDAKCKGERVAVDIPDPEITLDDQHEPGYDYEPKVHDSPRNHKRVHFDCESDSICIPPNAYGSHAIENFQPERPTMVYGGNQDAVTDRMFHSSGEADEYFNYPRVE
jgi:hypothetical protein